MTELVRSRYKKQYLFAAASVYSLVFISPVHANTGPTALNEESLVHECVLDGVKFGSISEAQRDSLVQAGADCSATTFLCTLDGQAFERLDAQRRDALIAAGALCESYVEMPEFPQADSSLPAQPVAGPLGSRENPFSAQVYSAYQQANSAQRDRDYKGKWMADRLTYKSINTAIFSDYYISFRGPNGQSVDCVGLSKSNPLVNRVIDAQPGLELQIEGTINILAFGALDLRRCSMVE
jgi:hypothetical protein